MEYLMNHVLTDEIFDEPQYMVSIHYTKKNWYCFQVQSTCTLKVAGTKQFNQGIVGHVVETPPQIHLHFVHV